MASSSTSPVPLCAVVVTYHPAPAVLNNIAKLREQFPLVIIVDNGSGSDSAKILAALEQEDSQRLIRNPQNLGIATALNQGLRLAVSAGFAWVATFDQDSTISPGFVAGLLAAYQDCPYRERVALVSPSVFYPESAQTSGGATATAAFTPIRTAMTSGSLLRTAVFATVGHYDESLFIDYVDYDYCLRLQRAGYALIRANRVLLRHRLGAAESHSVLGRKITLKSHSAWRRYYITRNRVLLYRRYVFEFPLWCLNDLAWFFLELTKIILFEHAKAAKLTNVARGLAHGLIGKTGPLGQPPA